MVMHWALNLAGMEDEMTVLTKAGQRVGGRIFWMASQMAGMICLAC